MDFSRCFKKYIPFCFSIFYDLEHHNILVINGSGYYIALIIINVLGYFEHYVFLLLM